MSSKPMIVVGDKTSHGGTVVMGTPFTTVDGKMVARVGDPTVCPIPGHGSNPIVTGDPTMIIDGAPVALHGDKTACGAVLISGQFTATVGGPGGSAGRSDSADTATTSSARSNQQEDKQKKVTKIYWSYGRDRIPIGELSRHYVDLNVHLETEGYEAGELVSLEITIEAPGDSTGNIDRSLTAVVADGGKAVIENVFADETYDIDAPN